MKKPVVTVHKDKISNRLEVYDNYAVILDSGIEPFLLTQYDIFMANPEEIYEEVRKHKANETFKRIKRFLALGIITFAIPLGILYILSVLRIIEEIPPFVVVFLKEFIFIAALAILILWHDLSTNFDTPKDLPRYPDLDDFIVQTAEENTIHFSSFKIKNPIEYLHPVTKKILYDSVRNTANNDLFDTERLLRFIVRSENVQKVLKRLEIDDAGEALMNVKITNTSAPTFPFNALQSFILYATEQAIITKSFKVYPEHLLLALFNMFPVLKDVLKQYQVAPITFEKTIEWYIIEEQFRSRTNLFDMNHPYYAKGGVADSWVKGFTFYLDKFATNITNTISERGGLYGIGHTKEINYLMSILQKQYDANTILVGDPGVGKSSVIWGLAQRIIEGNIPSSLRGITIKSVDINRFLTVAQQLGGLPNLIQELSRELKNQVGTILYFDELEVLLNTGSAQGSTISYLLPLLIQSPVPIVGTMTYAQFNEFEKNYPTVLQSFSVVRVDEVSTEDTYSILATKIRDLENKYKIFISFPALNEIIKLSEIYMPNKRFPKKAVEILDAAVITASQSKEKKLTRDIVKHTIAEITKINSVTSSTSQAQHLLDLADRIHQKYINQEEAVTAIVDSLQRSQTMLRNTSRSIGVFLFLGPSGVGKTELAKITAEEYFGSEYSVIRVDLSQFKNANDMSAIVRQLEKVTLRPYSLVLLDELEKAPQNVLDMFLRLFDEGIMISEKNENLYFNNTIIICTSNIGSDILLQADPEQYDETSQIVLGLLPQYFRPEFVNRFDKTIIFKPLSKEHLQQICYLNLETLRRKLSEQGIQSTYSEYTINTLVDISYDPGMGARPLKRAIQDLLEANVARYMLEAQSQGNTPDHIDFDQIIDRVTNTPDNYTN